MKHLNFPNILAVILAICFVSLVWNSTPDAFAQETNDNVADTASPQTVASDDGSMIIVKANPPAPLKFLYSTQANALVQVQKNKISQSINVSIQVIQGKPKSARLGINGPGEVTSVNGTGINAWAIRTEGDKRFLDLELAGDLEQFQATVVLESSTVEVPPVNRLIEQEIAHLSPGQSVGFNSQIHLNFDPGLVGRVVQADGFVQLSKPAGSATIANDDGPLSFQTATGGKLVVRPVLRGAFTANARLSDLQLTGSLRQDSDSVQFQLTGKAHVAVAGTELRFLGGTVALAALPTTDDYHVQLVREGDNDYYELVFPKAGDFNLDLPLVAAIQTPQTNWQAISFSLAASAVVPIRLEGFPADLDFSRDQNSLVPIWNDGHWDAFLPANGLVSLQWKNARTAGQGKLFFTSNARIEAQVGPGLLRQTHSLDYQVLQGQLKGLSIQLAGPGEIMDVQGQGIVGWKVESVEEQRTLSITLSQPIVGTASFIVRSQTPLGAFPVQVEGLRLKPKDAVRHSGHLRISNSGSVRLTPTDLSGLTQLGPEHFPGDPLEARQLFVYRFPSGDYAFSIIADRIQPEVNVNELTVYTVAQADRSIAADMELDIREAPIREWHFAVPDDYSIISVTGANVADYIVGSQSEEGHRDLNVIFNQDVAGRQLISIRMEKNTPATAGDWLLPRIEHPDAKALRGDIGVVGAPGFRVTSGTADLLVEKPISTFPVSIPNLQMAFRIRQPEWTATMQIEQLERSIQSDVFHLYSLSQGNIYGSVLVNYFVTGAPTSQWELQVPAALGNVTVDGQDIRSWRREGDRVLVNLHQPVMGPYTLLLTFEQKPAESDSSFSAGQVTPLNVQGDRGYVQIVSPVQVEIERMLVSDTLLELDPLELPAEFRLLSTAPALGTWQYTQRPFDLTLKVNWFQAGTMATQVVEFSEANSHVSSDGELVTDVVYYVKSRGQRNLRIKLPPAPVRLWAVSVAGQPVNARQAQDVTLIPLPGGADPNIPIEVSLRLGKPAEDQGSATLALPSIEAPVLKTQWNVKGDDNHVLVRTDDTIQASQPVVWPNGFDWLAKQGLVPTIGIVVLVALASVIFRGSKVTTTTGEDTTTTTSTAGDDSDEDSPAPSVTTTPVGPGWLRLTLAGIAGILALTLTLFSLGQAGIQADPPAPLELNIPVLAAGQAVGIQVQNIPTWQAYISWLGVGLIGGGLMLLLLSRVFLGRLLTLLALAALGCGTLLQFQGAMWFFGLLAILILFRLVIPVLKRATVQTYSSGRNWMQRRSERRRESGSSGEGSGVATTALVFAMASLASCMAPTAVAQPNTSFQSSSSLIQQWAVTTDQSRLTATGKLKVYGLPGDQFLLLRAPAVLAKFESEELQLTKAEVPGISLCYIVTIPGTEDPGETPAVSFEATGGEPGDESPSEDSPPRPRPTESADQQPNALPTTYEAEFEYRVEAINPAEGLAVLTGRAAFHQVDLVIDRDDWEIASAGAAQIQMGSKQEDQESTHATLLLQPTADRIVLRPQARDLSSEETRFFIEGAQVFVPGPGVVDGRHRISVRTAQGRTNSLEAVIPAGLTVSSVAGPVTSWQFDAETRKLNMEIDPSADTSFDVMIETQRALDPLPTDLEMTPVRVEGAEGEVGLIAIAFGSDAQPEKIESETFSQVNIGDFDGSLVAGNQAVIQRVYRYGTEAGTIRADVIPVAAEVRVVSRQVLSLGDERIVLGINFVAEITRTGVFQLSFPLPDGLEIESLSGDSLHHWSEVVEDDQRKVIMDLNGKTIGSQAFALSLAGPAPTDVGAWQVPRFQLDAATRQSGELLIRPVAGIRLQATTTQNTSELDPREMGGNSQDSLQGTLAFRLLQRDWDLVLDIQRLDPWITAEILHELHLREGQTRSTLTAEVSIEHAAVRSLQIDLQINDPDILRTVRATGAAVSDLVQTSPESTVWELQFKRRVIGNVQFQIEYERRGDRSGDTESLTPVEIVASEQTNYFFAVRAGGRLEIEPVNLASGWQQLDWNMVPPTLREAGNQSAPALTLRPPKPAIPLAIRVIRHSLAEALKLRVTEGMLTTVLSPSGDQLTAVDVDVEVIQRSSMAIQLPEGGELFSIFVNGESVHSVRLENAANGWQFYILPGIDDRTAQVRFVYLLKGGDLSRMELISPQLNVPLENVQWNVVAPPGFQLTTADGNLELLGEKQESNYDKDSYLSLVSGKRQAQAQQAAQLLQQASELLQAGEQSKARWALNNVANRYALDAASNEDARVQLENLQTQQAVVGLNTRRQRLFLDNKRGETNVLDNEQLLQAAAANPILQQDQLNFRPQELSQLLAGNTREDNAVLQQIAGRLVQHQRSTDPAPQAIVISLPEEGTVYRFSRGVQVSESAPLELDLRFHSEYQLQWWQWAAVGGSLVILLLGLSFTWKPSK